MSCIKCLRTTNANLKTKPSNEDLAGYVIRKLIGPVMNAEQFKPFGLGRTESQDDIMAHLFRKGLQDYQAFWKAAILKIPPLLER